MIISTHPYPYFNKYMGSVMLHTELVYAAVVYLKTLYSNGKVSIHLVASKSRVAPMKEQTIPRLELLGPTILAHFVDSVLSCFQFRLLD